MENKDLEPSFINNPEVILTRKTTIATILLTIARKGETMNELLLKYIPVKGNPKEGEQNPEEVCNQVLRYLSNSFGWYEIENERRIELQEFESLDKAGQKINYKAHVWIVPIKKHGALIR